MSKLLPTSAQEAFEVFEDDAPRDCHRHCACFDEVGECCECGEKQQLEQPIPIHEFFKNPPKGRDLPWWDSESLVRVS